MRLHGVLLSQIEILDLPPIFGRACKRQWALNYTLVLLSIDQTDGQTKRTIQTLEDMLWACVLEFQGAWEDHIALIEFAYNNQYHSSIGMAPYEALYGRQCRCPIYWDEERERILSGPELVQETRNKVEIIRGRIKAAQDRQKRYADPQRR